LVHESKLAEDIYVNDKAVLKTNNELIENMHGQLNMIDNPVVVPSRMKDVGLGVFRILKKPVIFADSLVNMVYSITGRHLATRAKPNPVLLAHL
jgi:hypothetical protein